MASPAKTSSSSSSIPCRANPNMKKSELCDPIRRSFSGNPFTKPSVITNPRAFNPNTPVNSPSDFPRRHSTGRESVASLRDPDKENSKDQNPKPTRVRSPALSKGTKNFMSPTISAASKINASPRKKILVERNEPVRSSVSFSDVKSLIMEDNESTPEIALKQVSFSDVKSVITEDESTPKIGLNQKKVSFFDVKSIIMEDNESTPEISWNQKKKVSFADVKSVVMEDNESTPQIGLEQKNVEVPHNSQSNNHEYEEPLKSNADIAYKESKNDFDSLMETFPDEKGSVNVESGFKISPTVSISPSCPILAPLDDADPLMLPYDPKNNYLSPRPQFLHYRPNPRIELYREREGKQLEEHFASESYSDTDVTEESQSEGSQAESEDVSSEETKKEGEEEEEELRVSEPNPIAPDMVEESFEAKRMSKSRFSTRSKFIALLLVLAFAYFSVLVVNSPDFTSSGLEELSVLNFQVPPEVTEFAKANFDRFTENLQHWSASFLSYVSNIISSSREVDKLGLFEYANLSHLLEDRMIEGQHHLMFDHSVTEPVRERDAGTELFDNKYYREIEADEAVRERDAGTELFDNKYYREIEADEAVDEDEEQDDQKNEAFKNLELVSEEETDVMQQEIAAEMIELDQLEAESKGVEFAAQIDPEHQSNVDLKDQPSIIPQATEIQHDISNSGDPEGDDLNNIAETMFPEEVKSQSSGVVESTINGPEDQFFAKNVMGFLLLVLCLLAASALIYTKRGKPSMPNASVPVKQQVLGKESEYNPVSGSKDTIHERLSSRNWQTEVDMANESCPSDMSSLRTSSSYSKKGRKTRKTYRRESLASSDYSTGSPSYGSFTTYEKKPSKHGGDEEIVTPIRRSSRIRNQATSP